MTDKSENEVMAYFNSFHSTLGTACKPFQESIRDPFLNQH